MRYRIETGRNLPDLEKQVNYAIKAGWKPQGGLVIQGSNYAQALVKNDEKDLEQSWKGEVDRQGGSFSQDEIDRSREWR